MILVACLSVLISALSPFWGLIFIFTIGAKYQQENLYPKFYGVFLLTAVVLYFTRSIEVITLMDMLIGVALTSYIFFNLLQRKYDYAHTIVLVFIFNVIYGILRYFLFSKQILQSVVLAAEELTKLSAEVPPENQAMILFFSELVETTEYIISNFFPGIWVLTIMLAIYLGSLLLSARSNRKWLHKRVRMPYELIYPVIICLGGFLFPSTRIISLNGLIMLLPLWLIQGLSILDHFWGDQIRKSKILIVLLVLALVFNLYLVAVIAVLGLTDIWFNFRKIRIQEEINEDNLN